MKLRDLLLVLVALVLLATVVGIALLYRLYVWKVPPAETSPTSMARETPKVPLSLAAPRTTTPFPPLVTPTPPSSPTVTSTPSPMPSPTPTATSTPTLTPTPLAAARLAGAHKARREGDYAVAQNELQNVLQNPDAEWQIVEARYQAGIVAYLDGQYKLAQELLAAFVDQHPEDHRAGAAHFYLAEALTRQGEYTPAIGHYTAYIEHQDVLADLVYTRIANNHLAVGAYQDAIVAYERALEHAPDLGQQYDLREQIALAYSAWGHYEEAIAWLQGITARSQNVYRLARIWYLIGETHRLAGQEEQALEAFAQAVNGDPRPGYAHLALVELVDAGIEVNEYQRGLIDYHAGSYKAAVAAFTRYVEATPDHSSDALYYLALSYLEDGALDRAIGACQQAIDLALNRDGESDARWGDLWLLKGQALAQQADEDRAVATYVEFAETSPDHPLAPEARWRAARLLEQVGRLREATDAYTALADAHGHAEQAPAARFRAGLARYRSGDLDAAFAAWQELENDYPASEESLAARYWLGKMLWSRGQVQEARTKLQALADEHPRNYYGLRAAHLIQTRGKAASWRPASSSQPPAALHLTSDEQVERQEAVDWLRSWAGTSPPDDPSPAGDPSAISAALAGHILFRRAMEMNALSLNAEARDTFEELRQETTQYASNQRAWALYQLALLTRDLELYAPSMRATIDLIVMAPEPSVFEMPRLIQRLAFPVYYADLIVAECATYDLDPLLMFALIRQESVFDAQAVSWAGATGLTQVMPSTGQWIAEMMAWPEYDQELLQRAYLNVKFGAWFLARILGQAKSDVMTALAGYNGGPARAQSWLEQAGGDPDLFVEMITRDEPQQYVRLIYRHYDAYARLYGDQ